MSPAQRTVFVFDSPRTCSQLFNKLLASHPQLTNVLHPLIGASMYGPENVGQHLQKCEAASQAQENLSRASGLGKEIYTQAVTRLIGLEAADRAEGKIPWIKDHAFCVTKPDLIVDYIHNGKNNAASHDVKNPTVLPDSFFFNPAMTTVILVRHPALILSSYLRVQKPVFKLEIEDEYLRAMISLHWARLIFDAYQPTSSPIVIDAADLLNDPKGVMTTLCALLNLSPDGVQYEWDAVSQGNWPKDPIMQGFFGDLLKSEGIERRRVEAEASKKEWKATFGEEVAAKMSHLVAAEMGDYEHLWEHRLQIKGAQRLA